MKIMNSQTNKKQKQIFFFEIGEKLELITNK